jgi:hypothetical protein
VEYKNSNMRTKFATIEAPNKKDARVKVHMEFFPHVINSIKEVK